MKIIVQSPTAPGDDEDLSQRLRGYMAAAAEDVSRPDTQLVFNPSTGMHDMRGFAEPSKRFCNDGLILKSLLAAAADQAADGAIVHCFWDSALWPAREILDKPVVGLAEASMTLAAYIGRRFAILAVNSRYDQGMEDLITLNGFRARAIDQRPVRSIGADETQCVRWLLDGEIDRLTPLIYRVGRECIAEGADVIIFGCGLVSVVAREVLGIRDIDGVPIVTPIIAAVKMVETLVDIGQAGIAIKSARGYWGSR